MNIIKSIGAWGVKTWSKDIYASRIVTPEPGDIIQFWCDESNKYGLAKGMVTEDKAEYPFASAQFGRIIEGVYGEGFSERGESIYVCCELGSAFLTENGSVSVSGGPFDTVPMKLVMPAMRVRTAQYWNWGDNSPGASQGVYYKIDRPLFLYCPKRGEQA